MSFNEANLTYSTWWSMDGIIRMWEYAAGSDAIATVEGNNYFGTGAKILRRNDLIRVTASDGKALYAVASNNPSTPACDVTKLAAGVTSFPT